MIECSRSVGAAPAPVVARPMRARVGRSGRGLVAAIVAVAIAVLCTSTAFGLTETNYRNSPLVGGAIYHSNHGPSITVTANRIFNQDSANIGIARMWAYDHHGGHYIFDLTKVPLLANQSWGVGFPAQTNASDWCTSSNTRTGRCARYAP